MVGRSQFKKVVPFDDVDDDDDDKDKGTKVEPPSQHEEKVVSPKVVSPEAFQGQCNDLIFKIVRNQVYRPMHLDEILYSVTRAFALGCGVAKSDQQADEAAKKFLNGIKIPIILLTNNAKSYEPEIAAVAQEVGKAVYDHWEEHFSASASYQYPNDPIVAKTKGKLTDTKDPGTIHKPTTPSSTKTPDKEVASASKLAGTKDPGTIRKPTTPSSTKIPDKEVASASKHQKESTTSTPLKRSIRELTPPEQSPTAKRRQLPLSFSDALAKHGMRSPPVTADSGLESGDNKTQTPLPSPAATRQKHDVSSMPVREKNSPPTTRKRGKEAKNRAASRMD